MTVPLLHQELDRIAEIQPAAIAFRFNNDELNYGELSQQSDQLAAYLQQCGVRAGDRIGICMQKSLRMPVSVYGVFKAGAAFVPIDPLAPPDRVQTIINDADVSMLVTDQRARKTLHTLILSGTSVKHIVGIDSHETIPTTTWDHALACSTALAPVNLTQDHLAYIMYTSGSTGRPKGLMHTHASGHAYARLSGALYGITPGDRMGNHSALHFDMSLFEFFTGPLHGATSVLIPEDVTMFPASLAALIEKEQLTVWYSVPGALTGLVLRGNLDTHDMNSLRLVAFAGEPFPPRYLKELMKRWPQAIFSNVYGPAEVNQCTHYTFNSGAVIPDTAVPIGECWDDTTGLIVDEEGQPAQEGELLIASPTMMSGYWNREDLNQQAFHNDATGQRFYRTGDLVRLDNHGLLHFSGRKDHQVKSRGYRIELEEVEAALSASALVEEAAAFTVPAEDGSNLIIAVVTGVDIDMPALQEHIAKKLPWYALPHHIQTGTPIPRTGTGKIDRKKLQAAYIEG